MQTYKEVWKDIPNYEGMYQVSNLGRVRSLDRIVSDGKIRKGKVLSPYTDKDGYLEVYFSCLSKKKNFKVHRVVLLAFVGNSDLEVNHKNGIKSDNYLENLEYCSRRENQYHACKNGLSKVGWHSGENHFNAKYSKELILSIVQMRKTMKITDEYMSRFNGLYTLL